MNLRLSGCNPPREEVVNVCLAEILNEVLAGSGQAAPEKPSVRRRRFDLKISYRGAEFVAEASYSRVDAVRDAARRVEEGFADTAAIAIYYDQSKLAGAQTPGEIREILYSTGVEAKIFTFEGDVSAALAGHVKPGLAQGWILVKPWDFPRLLDATLGLMVSRDILDRLAGEIEARVNEFIECIGSVSRQPGLYSWVRDNLYNVLFATSEGKPISVPDVPDDVIAAHAYISLLMASVLYDSVGPGHGLPPLHQLLSARRGHPLLALKDAFTGILEVDYEPVFDVAVAVVDTLFALQASPVVMQSLTNLVRLAQHVVANRAALRRDFIGYIYHKVTGDVATRKGYATFYTRAPVACFLAALAIGLLARGLRLDWSDPGALSRGFRVCDFACGSGTLLSGVYSALLSLYRKKCLDGDKQPDLREFHRAVLSECLWGFDALEHAAQTAATVLSLHEPGVPLDRMRVYHVPVDSTGSLGSLNFWWSNSQLVPVKRRGVSKVARERVELPMFDLIIMNPPFSRATAPGKRGSRPRVFGFVSSQEGFKRLWSRYRALIRDLERRCLMDNYVSRLYSRHVGPGGLFTRRDVDPLAAGASLPFFFLADRYLKPGGRIALVMPRTVLENSSYLLLRAKLLSGYDVEFIATSDDDGDTSFSYSTNFSEVLIVARKRRPREPPRRKTVVACFKRQPRDTLTGVLVAAGMLSRLHGSRVDGYVRIHQSEAVVRVVDRRILEEFIWNLSPVLSLPPLVESMVCEMADGQLSGARLVRLSETPGVSICNPRAFRGRQLETMFNIGSGHLRLLMKSGAKVFQRMLLNPSLATPVSPRTRSAAERYQASCGRLIIPGAVRFNSTPLMAAWSPEPLVSSRVHVVRASLEVEKALCAWLNSTFAVAWLRAVFSTLEGCYGHIGGWHIRSLRVPDLSDRDVVERLNIVFNRFSTVDWPSLPEQYGKSRWPLRVKYDVEILSAIGARVDEDWLSGIHGEMYGLLSTR